MQFSPGTPIGSLKIVSLLGVGGMGEVYLAQDVRLGRDVAIKVLPVGVAHDPERRSRFEREARVLAALNHPNIATLYGLVDVGGHMLLEMEFVPGDTLAERVERGPISVEEALPVFKQLAAALEAAHERGIIHRDLKPANIKVVADGRVKVLDFGLAKALAPETPLIGAAGSGPVAISVTSSQTQPGMILGTARYMSPEQARGQALDRRSDIWSFGCVLYEALVGRPPFMADTASDTLAAILREEPNWDLLPGPAPLQRLVRRCLRKDLQSRLRDIADARLEIEELLQESIPMRSVQGAIVGVAPQRRVGLLTGLGFAVVAVAALALWRAAPWQVSEPAAPARLAIDLPPGQQLVVGPSPSVALSADGRRLAYVAARPGSATEVYVRSFDRFEATPVAGTEGASAPFFSPDGNAIAFYARDAIHKVSLDGGTPLTICDTPPLSGAAWLADGTIVLSTTLVGDGLWRVPADGGAPERLTTPDPGRREVHHLYPHADPAGGAVVFTVLTDQGSVGALLSMEARAWRHVPQVRPSGGGMQVLSGRYLIAAQGGRLVASSVDLDSGGLVGAPINRPERVTASVDQGPAVAVSATGTLAYIPGRTAAPRRALVVVERDGRAAPLVEERAAFKQPRFSPDGRWLAVTIESESGADVWVQDLQRGTRTRLTTGDAAGYAVWLPDARRLVFHAARLGPWTLYERVADGSRVAEPLMTASRPDPAAAWARDPGEKLLPGFVPIMTGANPQYPMSWTPDGSTLAFVERKPNGERDIWVVERGSDPAPFLLTPADEASPAFSPDGRWLAYVSDESGRREVYVQPYPDPGGRWVISTAGGTDPVWSRDGRELYYWQDEALMAVTIDAGAAFNAGTPRRLFEGRYERSEIGPNYDVSPDGKRFVMIRSDEAETGARVHVVLNWLQEIDSRR
jgi:serine/threonine-protein kinase